VSFLLVKPRIYATPPPSRRCTWWGRGYSQWCARAGGPGLAESRNSRPHPKPNRGRSRNRIEAAAVLSFGLTMDLLDLKVQGCPYVRRRSHNRSKRPTVRVYRTVTNNTTLISKWAKKISEKHVNIFGYENLYRPNNFSYKHAISAVLKNRD
jgi:hypothetical protein